jgi:23S rRNA (guanosine2251-2'-O)-methyltransferase
MDGDSWCSTDMKGSCGLVIGSEGRGVSRLVKDKCDKIVSLPMLGNINSLNASVAAGILMYEIVRQRGGIKSIN